MLLIDSVFVNNGGGLVLLKYMVDFFEKSSLDVFYLFDYRTESTFNYIDVNRRVFISNSIIHRHKFYIENKDKFSNVICFGNLPPTIRLNSRVLVYFHQKLFLEIPREIPSLNKLNLFIKQNILNFVKNNADFWLVQTEDVKRNFSNKYLNNKFEKIIKLPFYPEINFSEVKVERNNKGFIYVSNSSPHKNHKKLIEAFCLAYDDVREGHLILTVPESDVEICSLVTEKHTLGYPIYNVGFLSREKLARLYLSHGYLIFPSLSESFGLGLVEAIDGGCKIIAADLPYTYEVCKPSLIFDPNSVESIKLSIIKALEEELPSSLKLIDNDISKLINILME